MRRLAVLAASVLVGALMVRGAPPVAARHNFSMLAVQPQVTVAGAEVTVSGFSYTKTAVVRFGSVDGPELARFEPTSNNDIGGTVRIPAGTPPGRHVLFAMHQDERGRPTRFPGRAAIVVTGLGGPPVNAGATGFELELRPRGPLERESAGTSEVVLAALATAGGLAFLVGLVLLNLSRRREATS